jgi:thiol-disulfide isomerase/thioredoxin
MKELTIIILSCILFTNCDLNKEKACYLTGQVIDRNSIALILKKQTDVSRYCDVEIPIDSLGYFSYEFSPSYVEAYELIFKDEHEKGAWRPILFFPDNDTIKFTLYPMQKADSNIIAGSKLSLEESIYNQIIRDTYYSKYIYWNQKKDSLNNINEINSNYAKGVSDSIDAIIKEIPFFELRYTENKANLYGYSKFIKILRTEKDRKLLPIDTLKRYHNLFQQKFPNHPYNKISHYRLDGLINIKVNGSYVNFTAPDATGKNVTLSNYIAQNKLTLVDLWAPWCGPCIRKSKKTVPIYEEFKNSGFGVIGVVGGISNQGQFVNAIAKHKYPWIILSEIDNVNNIWEKYSISKSGGSQFLLDDNGKIIAINPTPDELRELLLSM